MENRSFALLAVIAIAAVTLSALVWMIANPLPSYWDEAGYYAAQVHAARAIRHDGPAGFVLAWFFDPFRPPAQLLLALPFSFPTPSLLLLRLLSFAAFLAAAGIAAAAVRSVSTGAAGALSLAMLLVTPLLVLSLKMFGTEYPLLLAVAGCLWFLFASAQRSRWVGLGVCVGLGLLAKLSFAVVAAPLLVVTLLLRWRGDDRLPRFSEQAAAIALGLALASTWWLRNYATGITFGLHSRGFKAHSLGDPASIQTLGRWVASLARYGTGFGVAAAVVVVVFFAIRSRAVLGRNEAHFALACFVGAIPLAVGAYTGANHNPRLLAVPLLLVICAAGALSRPMLASRSAALFCIVAIAAQLFALTILHQRAIAPSYVWRGTTEVMSPIEQWDFTPVRAFIDRYGRTAQPRIALMGVGYQLNPPQVEEAWLRAGRDAMVRNVFREGFDLRQGVLFATGADVAITATRFSGDPRDGQPRINAYNLPFARALHDSGRFAGPFTIDVGWNRPAPVDVFLRRPESR